MHFISAKEAAAKWKISQRRVATLCSENRVAGATFVGKQWIIPSDAEKPTDLRTLRYAKPQSTALKPFVKWAGGKGQLVDELMRFFPTDGKRTFTKYAEPMVGGGALLFSMLSRYRFEQIYIGDINAELINTYTVIKHDVDSLIEKLTKMQATFLPMGSDGRKSYYYAARDTFNGLSLNCENALEKAAHFIFLNKTCFNGLYRVNRKGRFNVPMGTYIKPTICDERNLRNASAALQNVTIACGDYATAKAFIDENTFVYFDPPYRPISETSAFTSYNADTFDDAAQIRLARFIDEINAQGAKFILSNSDPQNARPDDTFFEELYKAYRIEKVEATRMINSNSQRRGKIRELIIHN